MAFHDSWPEKTNKAPAKKVLGQTISATNKPFNKAHPILRLYKTNYPHMTRVELAQRGWASKFVHKIFKRIYSKIFMSRLKAAAKVIPTIARE